LALCRAYPILKLRVLTLWIAYDFYSRGIVVDARAWAVALGGGPFAIGVRTLFSLMILRDPPRSLSRRLLALVGAIVVVSLSLVIWVLTLGWLGAA
jgi:hypothetical protein